MTFLRRLSFELWYLRHPPWESGIVPPEVVEFFAAHPPGRALDLGCGSGTSSLALARAGWTVRGVDFARHAIRMARQKARLAGLSVDFRLGDVTNLPPPVSANPYDLVLDIGCFHGLTVRARGIYLDNLQRLLAPGGSWLMYGFFKPQESPGPGLTANEPQELGKRFRLVWRRDGVEKKDKPSAWFCFQA
jgi:cyclopropane fatty-acyl-phospholipid synthase-like methyltransferase